MPHSPVPEVHGLHNPIFGSATSNRNFGERAGLQSGGIGALGTTTPDCLQKSGGKMHHHGNWHLQSRWTQSREDLNYCVSDLYLAKVWAGDKVCCELWVSSFYSPFTILSLITYKFLALFPIVTLLILFLDSVLETDKFHLPQEPILTSQMMQETLACAQFGVKFWFSFFCIQLSSLVGSSCCKV